MLIATNMVIIPSPYRHHSSDVWSYLERCWELELFAHLENNSNVGKSLKEPSAFFPKLASQLLVLLLILYIIYVIKLIIILSFKYEYTRQYILHPASVRHPKQLKGLLNVSEVPTHSLNSEINLAGRQRWSKLPNYKEIAWQDTHYIINYR